jgi:proline iminopeptidase
MTQSLFPSIQPFNADWLQTTDNQQLYYEQSGNPNGIAVIYLHGGPGGGSNENYRRYFDPEIYHIIQFDQRGCGQSKPSPSIVNNDCAHQLADIEQLRKHLNITKWLVTGGSWGSTLALLYGIEHAEHILGFILRGIFLGTKTEYDWLYQPEGAARFFPEYYQEFIAQLSKTEQDNPLAGYNLLLNGENELAAISASKAWYLWESRLSSLENYNLPQTQVVDTHQALCMAKISSHYFNNNCFIPENYILNNIAKISHLPSIVIHGRYDMVCQIHWAQALVKHWPNAQCQIMPLAGHSGFERQTAAAFSHAANAMASFINQKL